MDNLEIKTGYPLRKRIIFGGGLILFAVIMLVLSFTLNSIFLAGTIPCLFVGILIFTPRMGSFKTQIIADRGFLRIKWPERANINVLESEIDRIVLSAKYVIIFRKTRKDIKLALYDEEQKNQVFRFLTEFAKEKNLNLIDEDIQKR